MKIKKDLNYTKKQIIDIEANYVSFIDKYFSKKADLAQSSVEKEQFNGLITQKLISFHKNKDIKSFNLCIHNCKLLSNSIKDFYALISSISHYRLYDKEGNLLFDSPLKTGLIRKYYLEDALFHIKKDIALFLSDYMDNMGDYRTDNYVELEYIKDRGYYNELKEEVPALCSYQSDEEVARYYLDLDHLANQYFIEFPLILSEELIIKCHKDKIPSDIFKYIDDQFDLHRFITFLYTQKRVLNLDVLSLYLKNPVKKEDNIHVVVHHINMGRGLKLFRKQIINLVFLYVLDLLDQNKFLPTFCLGLHCCCYKEMGFDEEIEDTQDVTTA